MGRLSGTWLPAMMAIQLLHGLTFALLHLANLRVLAETVPPRLAGHRADALWRGRVSAAVALLTLASDGLYAQFGGARVLGDGRVVHAARGVAVNLEFEPPSPLARKSRSLVVPQSQKTAAWKASSLLGDPRFESGFLQRRVCKLSVPLRNLPQLLRSEFWHGPTQFGEGFSQATTMLQPVGGS
jgi:hypothetical protein